MLNSIDCLTKSFNSTPSNYVKRISNSEWSKFKLDFYLKQILIGNILGDVYMRRLFEKANARIKFRQGSINAYYLLHLYNL